MEYKTISIDKIKLDPNQPRHFLNEDAIDGMAISIKNEGIINAIEIDSNFVIVTGEQRFRAAKKAGLKEVPVKIIDNISSQERFIRQVQENVAHNTMAPLDTAKALDKIRKYILPLSTHAAGFDRDKKHMSGFFQKGVKELHNLLGMEEETISQYLDLLGVEDPMKEALKDPTFSRSKVVEVKRAPKEYQKKFEEVVATQRDMPRDTVRNMATALNRANKYGETELAEKLLKENFNNLSTVEAITKINKIIPDEESRLKDPSDRARFISEKYIEVMELLDNSPLESLDIISRSLVIKDTNNLGVFLGRYLKEGQKIGSKKLLEDGKK